MFLKKSLSIFLVLCIVFTFMGCNANDKELSLPYLSETYNNKLVLYVDKVYKPSVGFQYSSKTVTLFPNVKEVMDKNINEDVYYAVGVKVETFPDNYVLNFKYKGKSIKEYNSELSELEKVVKELDVIYQVFNTINYQQNGNYSNIDYQFIKEFGEIKYSYNGIIYKVDESTLLKFVKEDIFYINYLHQEEKEIEDIIRIVKDTIEEYKYELNLAVLEKHTEYFKKQGFPTYVLSPNNGEVSFIVIYVEGYFPSATFEAYEGFKYYFSMVGRDAFDNGFNWDDQI